MLNMAAYQRQTTQDYNIESMCVDQRKAIKKRVSANDFFRDTEPIIADIRHAIKLKNAYSVVHGSDIHLMASEIGIGLLRGNPNIQLYIKDLNEMRYSPVGDTEAFKALERTKEPYGFLYGFTGKGSRKLNCSEDVEHRIGELANDCRIYASSLLPICQLYGFDWLMSKLGTQRDQLQIDIMAEKQHIESFLELRLINLWLQFRKRKITWDETKNSRIIEVFDVK